MNHEQQESASHQVIETFRAHIGKSLRDTSLSPYGRWLSGTILAVERGVMEVEFTVRPEMLNPAGTFHGGVVAGIMDEVIGMAIFTLGKKNFFTSVNLVVDYFASAKLGESVITKTAIIKEGATIMNAQCEVWNAERTRLLARGTTNLMKSAIEV